MMMEKYGSWLMHGRMSKEKNKFFMVVTIFQEFTNDALILIQEMELFKVINYEKFTK